MRNVGSLDRIIRGLLGLALLVAPFVPALSSWFNPMGMWASIVVGVVLLATSVMSFCPIYFALGLRTRPKA